jgi:hypothetical protein
LKFVGLTPEVFWPLLGGMALIVALLYLLKLRRRRVTVPFSPIWARVMASKETRTLWNRLKRLLSLLVQIFFLALIITALADPKPEEERLEGRNVVLLVDTSASMAAIDVSGGVDRLDIGRQRAREVLGTLGPLDNVMLVTMDGQLRPVTPFVKESAILSQRIADLKTTATPADIGQALRFVRDAVRGKKEAELHVFSDGAFSEDFLKASDVLPTQVKVKHHRTGESGANVAVTAFNARRYIKNLQDYELYAEVRSYFEREVEVELQLYADDNLAEIKKLTIPPNGSAKQFFPDQGFSGKKLEARIKLVTADARDVFAGDDSAYAVLPRTRDAHVALVTTGNLYLRAPFHAHPNVTVETIAPADWTPERTVKADIVVFDRFAPKILPQTGNFMFIAPQGEYSPWPIKGEVLGPVVSSVRKKHPLARWLALKDTNIAAAVKIETTKADEIVATATGTPILVARRDDNRSMIALTFDITRSDLPLRVALPVLVLNAVDWFLAGDQSLVPTYKTGEAWTIPVSRDAEGAVIVDPRGVEHPVPVYEGKAIYYGQDTGFHTVRSGEGEFLLAANLADPKESRILPPEELDLGPRALEVDTASVVQLHRDYWMYLVFAAIALLLLEWLSYNRRWTV